MLELASSGGPMTGEALATQQGLPVKFLGVIMNDLRRAGIVVSQKGATAGYRLARPASEVTLADVIRSLEGPLAEVRGLRPEETAYNGPAEHLREVWVALRASLRSVLEQVTLKDIVEGPLPPAVTNLTADPEAWRAHRLS